MTGQWVVLLTTGEADETVAYGPIGDADEAAEFAAFLTAEVDPATVRPLRSVNRELMAFYRNQRRSEPKPGTVVNSWRPIDQEPTTAQPWQVLCHARQTDGSDHGHECATEGDLGHAWHYCYCGYDWHYRPPACCKGTGFADYAAVPCPAPDCPVTVVKS